MDRVAVIVQRVIDCGLWRTAEAEHIRQDEPVGLAERLKITVPDLMGAGEARQKHDSL